MSLSQIDMFSSQPELGGQPNNDAPQISSSCPPKNVPKWLLFFEWDEEKQDPFQVFSSSHFGNAIKEAWIKSTLSAKAREKKLVLDGKTLSLFGKFDICKYYTLVSLLGLVFELK